MASALETIDSRFDSDGNNAHRGSFKQSAESVTLSAFGCWGPSRGGGQIFPRMWALFSVGKRVESTKCDASDEALTNRLAFDVCWPKIAKPLKHKRTKCGYHAKRKYKVPNEILAVKFVLRMRVRSLGRPAS